MQDDNDATRITIESYQHIAPHYAHAHSIATLSGFWCERLQRFADVV